MWCIMKYFEIITFTLLLKIPTKRALNSGNEVFLVTQDYCLTNGEYAITFNPPEEETVSNTVSTFYSASNNSLNTINDCKIYIEEPCISDYNSSDFGSWTRTNSIEGNITEELIDRRWEDLPLYSTQQFTDDSEDELEFKEVFGSDQIKNDFVISISIRIKYEAHMFLCEDFVTNSNCYWIMLEAWKGNTSALRKCEAGSIFKQNNKWPLDACKELRDSYNHSSTDTILDSTLWTHFTIARKNQTITVRVLGKAKPLLTFRDNNNPVSPRRLFFHSKNNVGFWKLHKYSYIYSSMANPNSLALGPRLRFNKGDHCLALYIVMCSNCKMNIKLEDENDGLSVIDESLKTENEKWKEFKFTFKTEEERYFILYTIRSVSDTHSKPFWAINSIRQCGENEYRILKSPKKNAPCQIVANTTLISATVQNPVTEFTSKCAEDTFGSSCVPCSLFKRPYCDSFKYCELLNGKKICSCSSGYESDNCDKSCSMWYYGHSCKKECRYCAEGCSNINGSCYHGKCIEDFTGDKCDQHELPLLVHAPEVINVSLSSYEVIPNPEFIGNKKPKFCSITYKENTSNTWIILKQQQFSNISKCATVIYSLEADSKYCVKVLLYTKDKKVYNGSAVKEHCFNISCIPYNTNDINIVTTNTSATVSLLNSYRTTCKIGNYKYSIDDKQQFRMEKTLTITNLNPIQEYVFHLHHPTHGSISVKFTTKEGVPSEVKNLKASATSNDIFLSWEEPEVTYGKVTYVIKYGRRRSLDCSNGNVTDYETASSNTTKIKLSNLKSYSEFEVNVGAKTTWSIGKYVMKFFATNASENLTRDEFPEIEKKYASTNELEFNLTSLKCWKIRGPIYLRFKAKCISPWCEEEIYNTTVVTYSRQSPVYSIKNLSSYTYYSVDIELSRNKSDWRSIITEQIATEPSVPNKIQDMTVTSKDERSISLRWIPPFPPTGILAEYKIMYNEFNHTQKVEQCRLWPDYHCATITKNINSNELYKIKLFARNEYPDDYVEISELNPFKAEVEKPQPPYDVVGNWTETDNFLVSWKHPNNTNGKVKKFVIKIEKGRNFTKYIDSEMDYKLTYTYLINSTCFMFCADINISVTVYNKKFQAKSIIIHTKTPPPTPCITNDDIKLTNNTNNTFSVKISNVYKKKSKYFVKEIYILISSQEDRNIIDKDLNILKNALKKNTSEYPDLKAVKKIKHFKEKEIPFDTNIPINSSIGNDKGERMFILFISKCKKQIRIEIFERDLSHFDKEDSDKGIYALLLLLLLIPLATYLAYIYKFKKGQTSKGTLLSIIQRKRKKDVEEVPLSEPVVNKIKPPTFPKPVVSTAEPSVKRTEFSKPIKIVDFEMYVKQSIESGELEKQHEKFPRGQTKPWDYGALQVNKSKNRYKNLIAYDHTRVKLAKIGGNEYSDYINANYVDGYRMPRAYIATQGPKSTTLNDFWRMVWQEKVKHIIMLANVYEGGKKKVEKYWPNINEEKDFNGIKVQYVSSKVYANYDHRVFKVSYKNQHREVTQLHFTSWPDHGIPLYPQSLVPFLQQILKIPNNSQSPVIVHCSAGVGRTGTIILCDICLRMAAGEGSLDFLANLEYLRSQRPNMVDNVEQYKLAHLVVLDCLFGMHTSISCDENMHKTVEKVLESDAILKQIRYLDETQWQDRAMDTIFDNEEVPMYPEKNRFQHIVPDRNYRICLSYYPYNDESSSYINAVQVDGFRNPGRFIVTQQPLPNTLGDFWRMVWERQCTVIISLNDIDPKDKSSCLFWPKRGADLTPVDYLQISCVKEKVFEFYKIVTLQVVNRKENESMKINIVSMRDWKSNEILPSSTENFLVFCEECDILSRNCEKVVVTCYDGSTASGLFIAATFLISKMKLEQECDVCLAVRTIRHNRKEFVTNKEQFIFLYEVGVKYIDSFESYSNFA